MPLTQITVPLTSIGGVAPYTYSVLSGPETTFPGTITINNTFDTLFLDASSVNSGTYTIKLQVADSLGNLFTSVISVIVDDPTIFSILNDDLSFAPTSFPVSFSIPLVSSGGNGLITWSLISSITTVPNASIDASNNLHFTLSNFGTFTAGLNAVDSIGNSVSAVVTYSINSSTVYALVDGQIEASVTVPADNLGTHHFTATVTDSASNTVIGSTFYQGITPISAIHVPEAYFDHYWTPGDTLAIVFPVQGDFQGFSLGPATITQPANGLTVSLDNVNKVVKVVGPPTLFENSQVRIPLPILQGTTQVATVSREYTLLSNDVLANGNFTFTALPRPYIVGDFVGLNAMKPWFNSPNLVKNSAYTVRVQAGSALPPGISLDSITSLLYGNLVGTTPNTSIIEYIDAQNIVHGTVTINWVLYASQFALVDNLVPAQIQVPYPTATATTNCLSSNSPSPLSTVSLVAGVIPAGLTISVDNTINAPIGVVKLTGTPTEAGYFDCWFAVTNTNGQTAYLYKRFVSNFISPLVILTQIVPSFITGQAYSFSLQAFGGVPPYTWSSPQWPGGHNATFPGLTLSSGGLISGTTTAANNTSENDTFILTDATNTTVNGVLNLNVNDTLRISTTVLPIIVPGQPYSFAMTALGGTPPYTWVSIPGVPPPTGITFNSSGVFSGVTSGSISTSLSITVTDSVFATANHVFSFITGTASGLQINTSGVGTINRGVSYQGHLSTFGPGTAPFSWQIPPSSPNPLPAGLSISGDSSSNGVTATISGTYLGNPFANLPVEVEVTDTNGNSAFAYMLLSTGTNLAITTAALPSGVITGTYSPPSGFQIQASGGVPPYTFSLDGSSPALPVGFNLSSSGVLSGTTATAYNQNIVIDVADNMSPSNTSSRTLNLLIQASTLTITNTSPLPTVTSGLAYSSTLTATGGVAPYSFSISPLSSAVLPAGLSISSVGIISGTTTVTGVSPAITFRVTDSINAFFDKTLTLPVVTGLTLKTGIDFTDSLSTGSLGYIGTGNVNSINPNPNHSFYVYATGVLSTQPSQLLVQLGGLSGATATVVSIVSGTATIQLNGPFQTGTTGSNSLTVTVTDQGVVVTQTFTWTVYTNPPVVLAPLAGPTAFPLLTTTFGGSNNPYMPVLEGTVGNVYIFNNAGAQQFNFQTYNGFAVDKPSAASAVLQLQANNTEWQGRLGVTYVPLALSGAGAFELGYNGASIDPNVINTSISILDADIAWFNNANKSYDTFTVSGSTGGQTATIPVYYLLNPSTAAAVTVAPSSLVGNGVQQTLTISLIKPLPPLQSDTSASIIWGGTVLTTNSIVPIYANGVPGSVTTYGVTVAQTITGTVINGTTNVLVLSFPSATTAGNTIILGVSDFHYNSNISSITDNLGNVYNQATFGTSGEWENGIYYAHIAHAGVTSITITASGTNFNSAITAVASEMTGLLSPVSLDGAASIEINGTTANSGTIFTSNANDVIFSNIGSAGTLPTGFTLAGVATSAPSSFYGGVSLHQSLAYRVVSAVGTYSPTWTGPVNGSFGGEVGNTAAFKLNPQINLVPNFSGIVGYTVQVTPPIVGSTQHSTLNLTLAGSITYLSADAFVTNTVTYMNNVNIGTITINT